jgi:hypothetical protein
VLATRQLRTCAILIVAGGLLAAGCGGGQPSRTSAGDPPAVRQAIAYSRCMRSHGVSSFPDPTVSRSHARVGIGLHIPDRVSASPAYTTAAHACEKLAPDSEGGGGAAAPITAQQHREIVRFAACMRSHGVRNFPDPNAEGTFQLGSDVNPDAPAFTAASQACQVSGMPLSISSKRGS